jgi:hypothetical protein
MDLIFSDIHADFKALNLILKVVKDSEFINQYGKFTRVINLGDILGRGLQPKEVINTLNNLKKKYHLISLLGNHDEAFLNKKIITNNPEESIRAHSLLDENDLQIFQKGLDGKIFPYEFIDTEKNIICVHGGPLDPDKITPNDAGENSWRYNKSWQRITESEREFFSSAGYHYNPSSAFSEVKTKLDNFVIFCGHQHTETVHRENKSGIQNILEDTKCISQKFSRFTLNKHSFVIEQNSNYLICVGLGGPAGSRSGKITTPHFCIIQYDPKIVTLFEIIEY